MKSIEPQINEVLLKQNGEWLYFSNPLRVISVRAVEEVLPALREIERIVRRENCHAAGFLGYEAASAFDKANIVRSERGTSETMSEDEARDLIFPLLWFGLYPAPRLVSLPKPAAPKPDLTWLPTVDRDSYNAAIETIKDHIAHGRTYQVNFTIRLRADFNADAWNFFLHLAQTQNNHAAYINTGRFAVVSTSPELFFQLDGETITCRPMKGTAPRGRTTLEDRKQAQWLKESEKNRAENVMIVDMIRNDLGRIAKVGSVRVPELFTIEKYPTLWQMTSTVQAETTASLTEILKALFPCASITGAPKISTMRIISELEATPRRIYTGSIGYIAPNRKAIFNVAIRTALIDAESHLAEYGVGGGIVWDSTSADEYAEALLKARVLTESAPQFSLFETMLWTPEEGFFLREKHIGRLLDSADYFDFPISQEPRRSSSSEPSRAKTKDGPGQRLSKETIEIRLNEISSHFTSPRRVRLLLDKTGKLTHEAKPFRPRGESPPVKAALAKEPVNSSDIFLYHKTTKREVYESARRDFPACDDVLLYNERGELTEFTIGSLVVEMDGKLFTPPVSCGLLPGVFRAHLLETDQVEERVIRVGELKNCEKLFRVNSVRRWERITLVP